MPSGQLGATQNFTMSGSSQQSTAFTSQTRQVRICTGAQPVFFAIGANPTASSTTFMLGANCVDYVTVNPGQKIAVLQAGTAGVVSITEMA